MKVFCIRTQGYKTAIEFFGREDFERFIDCLGDKLERLWVEVKEK